MLKKKSIKIQKKNNSTQLFNITLIDSNNKKTIITQSSPNTKMNHIKQLINEKILQQEQKQTHKIIGVESVIQDPLLDYKIQKGIGYLQNNLQVKFLYKNHKLTGLNKYKLLKCLATGGFSKVYLARSLQTGQFLAAKFVDKLKVPSSDKKQLILNEKKVNQGTSYPFLVKMHEFIQTDNFYVFIMDYCPGGELFYLLKSIKRMVQQQARIYFVQILLGIQYLHKKGIMYRDLKPENIMIDETGHIKIADFGLAKFYRQKSYSFCGSIEYMSPEIVTNSGHSFEVDYYCLGALLYELLIGCPPFYDPDLTQYETKKNIAYAQVQFPYDYGLSNQVKDLITKLLQKNPNQRLGHLGGAKQIMFHPWVGKINRTKVEQKNYNVPFIPDLSRFNFDPNEIGLSEQRFTHKIKNEYKILQQRVFRKNKQSNHEKKQSSCKKQFKQSLRKESISREKSFSPYKKKYSNSCKRIQTQNKSISNILSKKFITNPFGKYKNLMKEDLNKISGTNMKVSNKAKCPSFLSLQKKRMNKKNSFDMYVPKKFQTIKTEYNENIIPNYSYSKFKKSKQLTQQSQTFLFVDISNKTNKLSASNLAKMQIKNFGVTNIQKDIKYQINKSGQLKKSSNIKIKKAYLHDNSHLKEEGINKSKQTMIF